MASPNVYLASLTSNFMHQVRICSNCFDDKHFTVEKFCTIRHAFQSARKTEYFLSNF